MSAGRILVVDDEPQIRRLMRTTLVSAGYEVEDARSGEEGLGKMNQFHPDLVLLDINMHGMGGFATRVSYYEALGRLQFQRHCRTFIRYL